MSGDAALGGITAGGGMERLSALPTIADDNLLNFNEGTATTGWSITSGSGTLSNSSSLVRLTGTSAAVTADLALVGPTANDFIIMVKASAKYTSGQYSTLRFVDGVTTVFDLAFGYNHETAAAELGTISTYSTPSSTANNIVTGINYETTPQEFAIHIDRNFSCVNLFYKLASGKWNFGGSHAYNAAYSSLDVVQIITSAHSGQWLEYDWCGFARPNLIAIGDSICAGHIYFDPDPAHYAGEDSYNGTWMHHAPIYSDLRNNLILNKGVGGEGSSSIQSRMASYVTAHNPRVVFLHASSNDYGVAQATRTTNIQNGASAIVAASAQCVLLNAMHGTSTHSQNAPSGLRDYMIDWWDNYRPGVTNIALAIDIMHPMKDGSNFESASLCDDTTHPSKGASSGGYYAIGSHILTQ